MNEQNSSDGAGTLQFSAGVFGAITILADVITIILFLRDAITGSLLVNTDTLAPRLLVTAALFTLGLILLSYAKRSSEAFEWIIGAFAWCYIVLAATLLTLVSLLFVFGGSSAIDTYVSLMVLVIVVFGLGLITAFSVNYPIRNFAIPFMLAATLQAFMWVYMVFDNSLEILTTSFIQILAPFLLTSAIILILLFQDRWPADQNSKLIITISVVALFAAAFLIEGFIQMVGTILVIGVALFVIIAFLALFLSR